MGAGNGVFDAEQTARNLMEEYRTAFEWSVWSASSQETAWEPRALIYNDNRSVVSIAFKDTEDRRYTMLIVAASAKLSDAQAVALLVDFQSVNPDRVPPEIKAVAGDEIQWKAAVEVWLAKHYGGKVSNLPRDMRLGHYMCSIKGPSFSSVTLSQQYEVGEFVTWIDPVPVVSEVNLVRILPDWWRPLGPELDALIDALKDRGQKH